MNLNTRIERLESRQPGEIIVTHFVLVPLKREGEKAKITKYWLGGNVAFLQPGESVDDCLTRLQDSVYPDGLPNKVLPPLFVGAE